MSVTDYPTELTMYFLSDYINCIFLYVFVIVTKIKAHAYKCTILLQSTYVNLPVKYYC